MNLINLITDCCEIPIKQVLQNVSTLKFLFFNFQSPNPQQTKRETTPVSNDKQKQFTDKKQVITFKSTTTNWMLIEPT